jgi:hypothetical protein
VLFRAHLFDDIRSGAITVAFRRWKRPTVSQGGTLRTAVGVLHIDELVAIEPEDITLADARSAGLDGPEAVLASLASGADRQLYRVRFHLVGDDPRIELRERAELTDAERAQIEAQLDRWDRASTDGPWTRQLLDVIERHPQERSADLAARQGLEQPLLKRRVRQLKDLGLTESLEIGYRLAPRGAALLHPPDPAP